MTSPPSAATDLGPLPWRRSTIERILPHRDPFLFVDRIDDLVADQRVAGSRVFSAAEARLVLPGGGLAVPAAYLTECMAQVGAILVLSRPENRGKLIYFLRVDRIRFRSAVHPGDELQVEARPLRLRGRVGTLEGRARVGDRAVADGAMTFALGAPGGVA